MRQSAQQKLSSRQFCTPSIETKLFRQARNGQLDSAHRPITLIIAQQARYRGIPQICPDCYSVSGRNTWRCRNPRRQDHLIKAEQWVLNYSASLEITSLVSLLPDTVTSAKVAQERNGVIGSAQLDEILHPTTHLIFAGFLST